ncbi:MAG: sodium:proton exchanger [Marinilabiliales bacterium]|nr:MAG: sodium:proton exchanger [Marinilabiliales bacterium]
MLTYILFILGFVILIKGADLLVNGASSLGRKNGLSQTVIGLTVVALGTSLPELIINIFASFEGSTDLAIGNVLGSNLINTLFIIGVTALIYPIKMNGPKYRTDVLFNLFAIVILVLLANDIIFNKDSNVINTLDGIILLLILAGFLFFSFKKGEVETNFEENIVIHTNIKSILLIAAGILGLYFGGKWIVGGVDRIGADFGISQSVIGLTLIAVATSLPELVTSVIAASKKNTDLAIGNAIGSNVFNILLVLGASALIKPINFAPSLNIELGLLLLSALTIMLFIQLNIGGLKRTISRPEGLILVVLYICYIIWKFFFQF